MDKTNYFSASDLIKRSAAQICYFRMKQQERIATQQQLKGVEYQKKVVEAQEGSAEEMRGIYTKDDIIIFYSNDMIKDNILYEIKMIDSERPIQKWYFESALLQTAFYKSMLMLGNGILSTPTFRVKEGYKSETIKVNTLSEYHLLFGEEEYLIEVANPKKIVDYFVNKAKCTFNFDDAREYDLDHKFLHFVHLYEFFTVKLISPRVYTLDIPKKNRV